MARSSIFCFKFVQSPIEILENETNIAEARKDLQHLLKQLSKSEITRDAETITVTLQTGDRIFEFHSRKIAPISLTES
jgi:hypothetical protein